MVMKYAAGGVAWICGVWSLLAAEQVWLDAGPDNVWSVSALNWDAGAGWVNGNTARFTGEGGTQAGETVDVSGALTVAGMAFETNGYVIADADADGTLTLAGGTPQIAVTQAKATAAIQEVIAGNGGFTKVGDGILRLTAANAYSGTTTVQAGTLQLSPNLLAVLGATGAGNDTVVGAGATLDFNGAYVGSSTLERFSIQGNGVDGKGVLVNTGSGHVNKNLEEVILQDNAMIGGPNRIDVKKLTGNGKTLTKAGGHQLCLREVVNTEIVINEGSYTLLSDWRALGGNTAGDTTVNGGTLYGYGTMSVPERIVFNGGALSEGGGGTNTLTLTGRITMHNRITVSPGSMMTIELAGLVDGSGGFAQSASGYTILSCDTNTYSGATVISGGNLWVGRPGSSSGLWGSGDLTNSSSVYFYSGRFGAGRIMNSGSLYFDRPGSYGMSNHVSGTGTSRVRCKSEPVFSGNLFSNGYVRVIDGVLTLTNGAGIVATGELTLADPQAGNYTNTVVDFPVTGIVNITQGTWINAHHIVIGNPAASGYGQMLVGVINQYGGQVSTYGATAESNGIRIAHYPTALGTYNMKGGTLTVDGGWDLCVATDGTGWVHQTGGEIFASRVMLNERTDTSRSFGRLTVSGGVLNIGLTNGISNVEQDGIAADGPALYLVEFGGAGGVVRAQTNFATSVKATLYGVGTGAITFDTQAWGVTLSGNLTGDGGLNKTGTGTLTLSGNNTYAGPTRVLEGRLVRGAYAALPDMGEVLFGVMPDDAGGRLHADGDLALEGLVVGVADPEALDKSKHYTIATWGGGLTSGFSGSVLPAPWYVHADWANKRLELRANRGTVLWLR